MGTTEESGKSATLLNLLEAGIDCARQQPGDIFSCAVAECGVLATSGSVQKLGSEYESENPGTMCANIVTNMSMVGLLGDAAIIVLKGGTLEDARRSFGKSKVANKLLDALIEEVKKKGERLQPVYSVPAKKVIPGFDERNIRLYRQIKAAVNKLVGLWTEFESWDSEDGYVYNFVSWFQEIKFENGMVIFRMNPEISRELLPFWSD